MLLITGGTLLAPSGKDLIIQQFNMTTPLTIASAIVDNTTSALTLSGGGAVTLAGVNSYAGGTFVNAGAVTLAAGGSLPASGAVTINGSSTMGAGALTVGPASNFLLTGSALTVNSTLTLNSTVMQASGTLSGSSAGVISIGSGATFTATMAAGGAYNGTFTGGGTLAVAFRSATQQLTLAWQDPNGTGSAFTGNVIINGGLVSVTTLDSLPGSGANVTVNQGGTLSFGFNITQAALNRIATSSTGVVTVTAINYSNLDFTNFASLSLGGNQTFYGAITPNNNTYRFGGGGNNTLVVASPLTDNSSGASRSLVVGNNGTFPGIISLTNFNTFSGATTINAGTLKLDFTSLGLSPSNILYSGLAITQSTNSAQSLTLGSNPVGAATGFTAVSYGALSVTASSTAASTSTQTLGQFILNANTFGAVTLAGSSATIGLNLSLGPITRGAGSVLSITLPAANLSGDGLFTTTPNVNANGILGGWAIVTTTGTAATSWAVSAGSSGSPGLITALASYIAPASATSTSNVDVTATAALASASINSLRVSATTGTPVLTLAAGTNVIVTGGILVQSADTVATTISSGSGLTSGTSELIVTNVSTGSVSLTISTPITDNGGTAVGLTKSGSSATAGGPLTLTGVNTFSGPISVLEGTLTLGNATGTNGQLTSSGSPAGTYAASIVDNGTISFSLLAANVQTLSGVISGVGGITLTGASHVTFTNTNSYTGATTLNGATSVLTVTSSGSLGSGDVSFGATGATLTLQNSSQTIGNLAVTTGNPIINLTGTALTVNETSNLTDSGTIAGTGSLILGAGSLATLTLSGSNITYTGGTQVLGGVLTVASGSSLGGSSTAPLTVNAWLNLNNSAQGVGNLAGASTGVITLATGTTLTVTEATNSTYAGIITASQGAGGNFALAAASNAVLTLSGANSYLGTTSVNGGTLAINGNQTAATGAVTVASGATLQGTGTVGGAVTVNGAIKGGNSPGTLTINNNVTVNANAAINVNVTNLSTTPSVSLLNITGATSFLNLNPQGGTFSINLFGDGNDAGGHTYTLTIATVSSANIQLNGSPLGMGATVPTSDYTLSASGFTNSISSYSLMLDNTTGQNLLLSITTANATPEPHHIMLICASALLAGIACRRRWLRRSSTVATEAAP